MNCIYLKQKLNRELECKKDNKRKIPKNCFNCPYKKYKKSNDTIIKNKSSKLRKLENKRESLFTEDLDHCFLCHSKKMIYMKFLVEEIELIQ